MGLIGKVVWVRLNKELNKQSRIQSKWLSNQDQDHQLTKTDQSRPTTCQTLTHKCPTTQTVTTQYLNTIQRRRKQEKRELCLRITSRILLSTNRRGSLTTTKRAIWKVTWIINKGDKLLNQMRWMNLARIGVCRETRAIPRMDHLSDRAALHANDFNREIQIP